MGEANPTVQFVLTREEYLQHVRDCLLNGWAFHEYLARARRTYRNALIICVFFALVGLGLYAMGRLAGGSPPPLGLYMAVVFVLLALRWAWRLVRGPKAAIGPLTNTIARMTTSGEVQFSHGEVRVTLLPEGVLMSDQHATSLANWLFGIQRIEQSETSLLLFTSPSTSVIVPRRAFADPAQAEAFVVRARELFAARGRSPVVRVLDFLAGRDAPCPRCNYNLRDCPTDRCPECGEALSVEAIVRAGAVSRPSS